MPCTTGRFCEQCKVNFYRPSTKALDDPKVCLKCKCVKAGTFNATTDCEKVT